MPGRLVPCVSWEVCSAPAPDGCVHGRRFETVLQCGLPRHKYELSEVIIWSITSTIRRKHAHKGVSMTLLVWMWGLSVCQRHATHKGRSSAEARLCKSFSETHVLFEDGVWL